MNKMTQDMNQNMMNDKEQRIERLVNRFMTSCAKGVHALRYALVVVMVMGVNSAWAQPVEITTAEDIDNDTKKLYLIQTNAFPSFFIAPQADNTITTNNILGDYMLWYFLDAGTVSGTQYYYIVNNSTGKYIYNHNGNSRGIKIISSTEFANLSNDNKEKCKFKLVVDNSNSTTDFYNIDVKATQTYYGLNKQNGSEANQNPIRLTDDHYIHDTNSKWKFIRYNGSFTWPDPPFTISTDDLDKHYYKIRNVQSNTFYASTDATPDKVTYSNTESNNMVWYFKEAPNDPLTPWFKYYYIVNPKAGNKYMYYSGNVTDGSNQTDVVSVKDYDSNNDDRFQFVVVQAAKGDGSGRVTCYAIIPKLLRENYWSSNGIGSTSISNGTNMGIISSRSTVSNNKVIGSNAHWQFVTTSYPLKCVAPTITYSNATGKITISSTTPGNTIHYTTDGETEPTSSSGTLYSAAFDVSAPITIKAIATKTGFDDSEVTTKSFDQVATPSIQDNGLNAISITCATEGATIYYTTNGSTPTTSSTPYTGPLTENVSGVTIKAIAVKDGMINSGVGTGSVMLQCAKPIITRVGDYATISCSFPSAGVSIYYTLNGGTPSSSSTPYSGNIPVTNGDVIRAIAIATNYLDSEVAERIIRSPLTPTDGIYYINSDEDFETFVDMANADGASYHYVLQANVNASTAITQDFSGIFDGGNCVITGLTDPLFNTVDGGTVKNVTLKDVDISSSAPNVGAIAGVAKGYSRIYNCGILPNSADFPNGTGSHPSVTTTGACAGGIVGSLEDDSRVINCYSYADVSAATYAAGIVGNNTFASTAVVTDGKYADLRTAVVNCMFYGNITGGTNQYGVYGGTLITNAVADGISSYNYYRSGSTFTTGEPTAYNCSFPAEERYLTQVEFHRSLLNSNRELCGWWVSSDVAPSTMSTTDVQAIPKNAKIIYKWVVDQSLAPYPILKPFGKYASIINNPGNQTGQSLSVTVQSGSGSSAADKTISIPITNMDPQNHDYGYYKIQLPYFNTVFGDPEGETWAEKYAGNYTDYVVTGWMITSVTGGTQGSFVAQWETGYNFADRKCTDKDKFDVSGRVFAQGGYYYVPDGVTAITIKAYWGKAIYVRNDEDSYDRVNITLANTGSHFAPAGTRNNNVNNATISTSIRSALTNIDAKKTVYDYALVLVGNVQESVGLNDIKYSDSDYRGFTIMSVDLDFDEEPDYCLEWQLGAEMKRQIIAPIRFDFLPVVELGIAGKLHNSTNFFSLGCYRSQGHFEVTETAFIRFGQFEFELGTRDEGPVILNGGIYDQYCRGRNGETNQHINYVILGGHIVMPSFTPGAHANSAAKYQTRHCAVNALGGDFTSFYLTGGYNEEIAPYNDSPHCYIDGGHFGTIAAAYKEGIAGNVTWRINHALIDEFYGGGVMSQADGTTYKIVKGNIDVVIDNSIVGKYCGGPKFGDMESGKTVTTSATNTTFTEFYGAGNGGTNYVQYDSDDDAGSLQNASTWNTQVSKKYHVNDHVGKYRNTAQGYEANYDIEVINTSTGDQSNKVVNRCYYYSAQFATTNTGSVTSTLTDCTIEQNFYGGGFLGGVSGNVTSTLTNTWVKGSAFGAGYSASAGTVTIHDQNKTPPSANVYTGMIKPQLEGTSTTYYWTHTSGSTSSPVTAAAAGEDHDYYYTEIPLDNLGAVSGTVTLTINGNSKIGTDNASGTGNVYGGGDQSKVTNSINPANASTIVNIQGNTQVLGNVFGGGNEAEVSGSTKVLIEYNE
jgi:hypothetical protein